VGAQRRSRAGRLLPRHFADKRDVLFAGAADLEALLAERIALAPRHLAPLDAIAAALAAIGPDSMAPRAALRQRQVVIAASPELTERELITFDSLTAAFATGLRQRGVEYPTASLASQAGVTVFRTASERWVNGDHEHEMAQIVDNVINEFRNATAA